MSIMMCEVCDAYVDTDYECDGFCEDNKFRCESCLEEWLADLEDAKLAPVIS
jgi:hypothetical protein